MLRGLFSTLAIAVAVAVSSPAQGAVVAFSGTISGALGGPFAVGQSVFLAANFTAGAGVAAITSGSMIVNGQLWSTVAAGGTVTIGNNGTNDFVRVQWTPGAAFSDLSTPGGFASGPLDLTLTSTTNLGLSGATQSNLDTIYAASNSLPGSVLGVFSAGGGFYSFTGAAVPEPGSIALLSGLGLVFGRRVMKRRKLAKELSA